MNIPCCVASLALLPLALMAGCASSVRVDYAPIHEHARIIPAPDAKSAVIPGAVPDSTLHAAPETMPGLMSAALVPDDSLPEVGPLDLPIKVLGKPQMYTQFKLGAFRGAGDLSNQSTGFWGEMIFGQQVTRFFAAEISFGYIQSDGLLLDVWAIPLMVTGRVQVPITIFEVYGGVGGGVAYVDGRRALSKSRGFAGAGDAFVGAELGLGNLALALEGRYFATTEVDNSLTVEGSSLMLSLKLPF